MQTTDDRFHRILHDPARLAALARTGLVGSPAEEAFDRLARLAARFLDAPVALVSLLGADRHHFKACVGMPEPWATRRERPLESSFCQLAVARGAPLVLADAQADPELAGHPAVVEFGIRGYLGAPLFSPEGHGIGTFCVIDTRERAWSSAQVETLVDLARSAMAEIELRIAVEEARAARAGAELAEARFRDLVEGIDAIVWEADAATWRFTFVNRQAERILGYSVEEWLQSPTFWVDILHPADREPAVSTCVAATRMCRDHEIEYRAIARDGRVVWLRDLVHVVPDGEGRPEKLRGIMVDVTAKRRVEEELRYEKALLEAQGEASIDGVLVVSADGRIVSHNQRFVEMWGLPPGLVARGSDEEALRAVHDRLAHPEEFLARVRWLYAHPDEESREEVLLEDGRIFDRYSAPVRGPDGTIYGRLWGFRDVTDARQAERRKDEFLAMLGHELRNPLAPIHNALELMRLHAGDPDALGRARGILERQVSRMTRLVDDLLDVARITRGTIELRRAPVELAQLVARALEAAEPLAKARGHALTTSLPEGGVVLDVDAARIEQVLTNLLDNAIKYTEPGGHIAVTARVEGDQVALTVDDDGIGIAPELLPRVFEPFIQGAPLPERAQGGLGIGLTLVKRIVEMHGGSVEARSAGARRGSSFLVRVPLAVAGAQAVSTTPPAPAPRRAQRDRCVLIVDDNVDAAETLAELLVELGHTVQVAHDGPSAIAAALEHVPALVLLDIGLPGLDGYQVAERLRSEPALSSTKLIALTGYGQESDRRRAREAGFAQHVVKPLDPRALEQLLEIR